MGCPQVGGCPISRCPSLASWGVRMPLDDERLVPLPVVIRPICEKYSLLFVFVVRCTAPLNNQSNGEGDFYTSLPWCF
jgi:hypothetical protein